MNYSIYTTFMACAIALVGCGSSAPDTPIIIGDYMVDQNTLPAFADRVPDGRTPLVFTFTPVDPDAASDVTLSEWQHHARVQGITVAHAKTIYGEHAYINSDGDVAACIRDAFLDGLCGPTSVLSIEQRITMVQSVLAADPRCHWAGFDPSYHRISAYRTGG